ncbi:endonuclease/exonuclease/phosphatase family protein [Microbacterium sp. 1.5R]|uniref:endonuclease/exonuclease/phosphatase family protein n=1 Tax=Microbacterium sp. 1.5R TaxID=1916917 RepID=UPI0011A54642|nr:endonuclease/exonuclease/phosphatase family protein [Microbacterium sp. 1.5R]
MTDVAAPRAARSRHRTVARVIAGSAAATLIATVSAWVPGIVGTAASVVLPWVGLVLALLVVVALIRARRLLLLLIVPVVVWTSAVLPTAPGWAMSTEAPTLQVVSQNVRAHSGGAMSSAEQIAASSPDVIALTELDGDSLGAARSALDERYPHSYAVGTVGVWSRYPLTSADPLTLGLDWKRALRVTVQTPDAEVAVYVLHAASVRPGQQEGRDTMLANLADTVASDGARAVVAVGDFNAASADPALGALRGQLDWVRPTDGTLGFTWPAGLPLARIDQVFARGLDVASSGTMHAGASDHLATVTTFVL